jgi:hypothetical protein
VIPGEFFYNKILKEKAMATTDELLDTLIKNCKKPEDLFGKNGLLMQLSRKSKEQETQTEITEQRDCLFSTQEIMR